MLNRRLLLGGSPALLATPALSQVPAWPQERPVEVIIPFPAGGGVDVMARLIMPIVAAQVPGMRHIVTNRSGAAGQIGLEAIFNAAPDGYTIGATTLPAHNAIPMERPARFRAMDFTFLANVVEDANCFYVRADSPLRSLADVVAAARARPRQLTYGTTGVGSDDHLFMLNFEQRAGIPPLVHVPFPGAAPLIPQLIGGHMDLAAINVGDALQLKREGRLRILAQAAEARSEEAADVPTFREEGFDVVNGAARGLVAPPGLPAPITQRLNGALAVALRDSDFIREARRLFMPLRPLVGDDYRSMAQRTEDQLRTLWQSRPWRDG
ncbi:tripartite tricarboxylate transporter substrate binding protein [Roseococcus sp. YIM B11640]|uniref:tripartite tricarboxylate transporter substrate binding protein n=1 Tax=Roseococcus sp. YIM B11640 TaxID=3133973 RepID=UPI003C7ABEB1